MLAKCFVYYEQTFSEYIKFEDVWSVIYDRVPLWVAFTENVVLCKKVISKYSKNLFSHSSVTLTLVYLVYI